MADVGFGTGTPVITLLPYPSDVVSYRASSSPTTLLSLSQFAQVLGLDPLHFFGGFSELRPAGDCHDIWREFQWQEAGKASRTEIARAIHEAEADIASLMGYWPAWTWISDERHQLQRGGQWPLLQQLRVIAKWGYVISGGEKATTAISAANVTRGLDIDADGDGFAELAQFVLTGIPDTWDLEEVKACFKEYAVLDAANCRTDPASAGFEENWEVRPLQLRRSGTTVVAYVPVWLLFRPQLSLAHNAENIDADDADNYVDTISFYRVYPDLSVQAQFMWGTDCLDDISCAWTTQTGCIRSLDQRVGSVTLAPGVYDEDCDCYTIARWVQGHSPDAVRLWYRAGLGRPAPGIMDHTMARLVAMLACARLMYPVCTCGNPATLVAEWRENAAMATRERSYGFTADMISNPLGMRVGEVLVYQSLKVPARRVGQAVRA